MFQECVDCIDLDSTGRRWEGGINDGKPFGWGTLYNEDGLKEYEGFLLDTSRICYGKEYYPDICQIRYDGCYMNNQRFGEGILYDRKGGIEYDGLWKNDEPYSPRIDGRLLTNRTEFFFHHRLWIQSCAVVIFPSVASQTTPDCDWLSLL